MKFDQKYTFYLFLILWSSYGLNTTNAQDRKIKFGLKAGANITTILGPKEDGADEVYRTTAKITAGGLVKVPFSDRFGFIGEVSFIQKGAYYRFESNNSYLKLPSFGNQTAVTYEPRDEWTKVIGINLINSYVEVPLLFYAQPVKEKLEIAIGPSVGFLVTSTGLGTLKFGEGVNDQTPNPNNFFEFDLNQKYFRDEIGEINNETVRSAKLAGATRNYPQSVKGYYFLDYPETSSDPENSFDYSERVGSAYNTIDLGINFDVSFYFTPGLRLGARGNLGLLDITTNRYDISNKELNSDGTFKLTNHFDRNFSVQIFVGLQF